MMCILSVYVVWALLTSWFVGFEKRGGRGAATSVFRQVDRRVKPREGALEQIQKKRKQHQAPEMTRRPTIQLWHSAWHLFSGIYIEGYLGLEESYRQEQAWQLLVQKGGPATALNRDRGVSRTSWHKGNSSRMNRCIQGVSQDILGVLSFNA